MLAKMQKREKILVGAAGVAVLVLAINYLVCGKSDGQAPATQSSKVASSEPANSSGSANKGKEAAPAKRSKRSRSKRGPKTKFASWQRDPFAETWRLAEAEVAQEDSSELVLRGVIRKGKQAYVLIGDHILKQGESFGDLTVVTIKPDYVVCRKGKKMIRLVLGDAHVL